MTVTFGKANYNGGSTVEKTPFYKLGIKPDQLTMTLRFAPPLGTYAASGGYRRFIKQHFGYNLPYVAGNGEKKNFPVTFDCIEDKDRDGVITRQCPECMEMRAQEAKKDAILAKMKTEGKTEAEMAFAVQYLVAWEKAHNLDKKFYYIAKARDGKWGYAIMGYKCAQALKVEIDGLMTKGIDPFSPDKGVWFKFERTGNVKQFQTIVDKPTVCMDVQPDGSFRYSMDALTDLDIAQLEKLDLSTLGRAVTYDQINAIVQSGGDENVIRTVLNMPVRAPKGQQPAAATLAPAVLTTTPAPTPVVAPVQTTVATAVVTAVTPAVEEEDPDVVAAMKLMEIAKARKAAKAAVVQVAPAAPAAPPTPSPQMANDLEMDVERFMAQFGQPK
jgi:hypothetical protein